MKDLAEQFLHTYVQKRPLFLSLIRAVEANLFSKYKPIQHKALDVGCGDGFFAETVFGKRGIDIGLDVSTSRLSESVINGSYVATQVYDGVKFPFRGKAFKTVISNCVFEHVTDIDTMLGEIYRVLAPGGKAIFSVVARPWEDYLFGSLIFGSHYKAWMRKKQVHVRMWTYDEWSCAIKKSGLKISKSTGYLNPTAVRIIDISHYVSIPNLFYYFLTKNWVPFPLLTQFLPIRALARQMSKPVDIHKAAAIFFVCTKA